jgi:hypothetical protein
MILGYADDVSFFVGKKQQLRTSNELLDDSNATHQSPSCEANQEIPRRISSLAQKSAPQDLVLSQMNLVHTLSP